ncbi:MerC domain-containing protein [Mucilaginibacter sp. 14171R-50]|uniref:MerC domain-containing protein n=1 Tax=Mucilaginibacter sp. 14171R-50 TaxID=2703789 RepID=UPI00138B3ADA|nr:MerC domain-containing protein [Mucilaginibacter sp. 14171R-50]QHS57559.1 MerC domain-containing protein [Mucilaginibacter sp. 14171R-50]
MISRLKAIKLDNVGMTASTLCAIHCAAVPVFFTSLPLIGLGFLANPWVEWIMIIIALVVGISSIGTSYFKEHHRVLPLLLMLAGFVTIIIGHLFITGWAEAIVVPAGGFTIAAAHFINYKYAGTCNAGDSFFHLKHGHDHGKNKTV